MRGVAYAKAGVLGARASKVFPLYPIQDYWYLICKACFSEICNEGGHAPNCIRVHWNWTLPIPYPAEWRLKNPIYFKSLLPGSGHRLDYFRFNTMCRRYNVLMIWDLTRRFIIKADGLETKIEGEQIPIKEGEFQTNNYPLSLDISGCSTLSASFYGNVNVLGGGMEAHYAKMELTVSYIPSTPPEPAIVKIYVYNMQNNRAVVGARVQLLSGDRIVADGTTGLDGKITFNNVPAGEEGISYTLLVTAPGFYDYRDTVEVKPATTSYRVAMTPKPFSWSDLTWTQWALIGGAVIVVGGVAMATIGRTMPRAVR